MSAAQSTKISVFLVDDHAVLLDGLRALLELAGDIEVAGTAHDGRAAVDEAERLQPDVVVMDIALPLLNGIDAARIIRERHPDIDVIILSMHATQEHVYRALQAGARGYLLKEAAGEELLAAVRTVASGGRYLGSRIADIMIDDYVRAEGHETARSPLEKLSAREREILQLVAEGKSSARIGEILHISPKSVETYRSRLMQKIGVCDIPSLVKFAIQHGLTTLE